MSTLLVLVLVLVSTVCLRGAVFIATNCCIQVLEEAGLLAKDASIFFYDKNMNLIENLGDKQVRWRAATLVVHRCRVNTSRGGVSYYRARGYE